MKDTIVKIFIENRAIEAGQFAIILMNLNLEFSDILAQMEIGRSGNKQKKMQMVRHYAVLKYFQIRI